MTRSKKALHDTTNKKKTVTVTTTNKKLDENQWRSHVLGFYKSHLSQSTYIEKNKIKSHPLRTRFDKSGLKNLKRCNTPFADAVIQYDFWFKLWKSSLCDKQAQNRTNNMAGFTFHVDDREVGEGASSDSTGATIASPASTVTIDVDNNDDFLDIPSIEEVEVEVEGKIPRTAKLDNKTMQQLILEFYGRLDQMSLANYIRHVKKCWPNRCAIYTHWKESGLEQLKFLDESLEVASNAYTTWCVCQQEKKTETNRKNASNKKALPLQLECFMRDLIKQLALCGQGLGKKIVRRIFIEALDDGTGKQSISRSTLNRFIRNYKLECKSVKNIDPVRISQVTPENRDNFYFRLDQIVKLCHSIDEVNCPWKDWNEVLAEYKINIDEMGSDPTKFRDVLLIPEEITNRIFQSTPEGDRVARHLSLLVFSQANGKYRDKAANIEGAAPPMMIHSKQSSKKDSTTPAERRINLYNEPDVDTEPSVDDKYTEGLDRYNTNLGMKVFTSPNGSMTKELFLEAMKHLIEHLSSKQGANGLYTFLLLDSHVSRWNPQALYLLFKNRVIPIFFPSHLTIVVQPQDNGVILFLHKCIEEAAQLERLFQTDTDISYSNRIVAKGALIFRDLERKKLMTRGRNSTTRSWAVTGMDPCNPYSDGWRENLELYSSMNGLKIKNDEAFRNYGVCPRDNGVCPEFNEDDVALLEEAVPNFASLASGGTPTLLNHPKAMCYAIANDVIINWSEKNADLRPLRPRAITDAENLALQHMEIVQILTAVPKSNESLLLDENYEKRKRDGIIMLTKAMEAIQVQPKDTDNKKLWSSALKTNKGKWHIHDGDDFVDVTTEQLQELYTINLHYNMFPNDKRLQENGWRSERRRRNEKDMMIQRIAKTLAEEERRADLKEAYDCFMTLSGEEQSFSNFESKIVTKIEKPSNHTVTVQLGTEEHTIKVSAHGNNTSSISQLVINNICKTIIGNSNRKENKKNKKRRGGRVGRVRRGSDGVVKSLQMDQQHRNDLSTEEAAAEKKKRNAIILCKRRLKLIGDFCSMDGYDDIWNVNSTIQLQKLKKKNLTYLLKIFDVKGRARLHNNEPIRLALSDLVITQASIDLLKANLLQQIEEYGEEYNSDDGALDSSFAADSIANTSIVENSIVDTSILDASILDTSTINSSNSLVIDIDVDGKSGDENSISMFLGSEISAVGSETDAGNESGDTTELLANLPKKKKTVSFNPTPAVRTFSQQATTSSSSSLGDVGTYSPRITRCTPTIPQQAASSSEDEVTPQQVAVTITAKPVDSSSSSSSSEDEELHSRAPRRNAARYRYRRTTRASSRKPSTKATQSSRQRSTRHNNNTNNIKTTTTTTTTADDASRREASPPAQASQPQPQPELRRSSRIR